MAGHSKWANIKHRKGAQDIKRGKIFTKLIREITVATRAGASGDPQANPRLRVAMDKALQQNMPKDTIERAIKRGMGDNDADNLEEVRYEGYAPGGVAIMVDCLTDNRNRTVAEVRHAFTKAGGNLGTDGSVSYLFALKGIIVVQDADENNIMEAVLECDVEDIIALDDEHHFEVAVSADKLDAAVKALEQAHIKIISQELAQIADLEIDCDAESSEKITNLIEKLEDLDDVQDVYTNAKLLAN